ncbi:MAG: hypothetical protein ACRC2R_16970 [Xenococcaceae cyanobacterium]
MNTNKSEEQARKKIVSHLAKIRVELSMNGMDLLILYSFLDASLRTLEVPIEFDKGLLEGKDALREALDEILVVDDLIPLPVKVREESK